jgi:low affinity Fe/Cu permease
MASWFSHFAKWASSKLGHPQAFFIAVLIIVVWAIAGPIFHFSDTWQLVINTGTTIITFLMVFLIQNTQNRDSEAMQVKLDELILSIKAADNSMLNTENLTEKELQHLQEHYAHLSNMVQSRLQKGSKQAAQKRNGKNAQ